MFIITRVYKSNTVFISLRIVACTGSYNKMYANIFEYLDILLYGVLSPKQWRFESNYYLRQGRSQSISFSYSMIQ